MDSKLNNSFNEYVSTIILQPIVDWLKVDKNVNVTLDDLISIINLDNSSKPKKTTTDSTSADKSVKPKKTDKPKKTVTQSNTPCQHKFVRGDNKGKVCGQNSLSGSSFCRRHTKQNTENTNVPTDNVTDIDHDNDIDDDDDDNKVQSKISKNTSFNTMPPLPSSKSTLGSLPLPPMPTGPLPNIANLPLLPTPKINNQSKLPLLPLNSKPTNK